MPVARTRSRKARVKEEERSRDIYASHCLSPISFAAARDEAHDDNFIRAGALRSYEPPGPDRIYTLCARVRTRVPATHHPDPQLEIYSANLGAAKKYSYPRCPAVPVLYSCKIAI